MSPQLFAPPPLPQRGGFRSLFRGVREAFSVVVPAEVEGNGSPTGNSVGKPSQASKELLKSKFPLLPGYTRIDLALKGPTDRVSLEAPQIMVDNAFYGGELSSFSKNWQK